MAPVVEAICLLVEGPFIYTFLDSAAISIVSARCTEFTIKYSKRLYIYIYIYIYIYVCVCVCVCVCV